MSALDTSLARLLELSGCQPARRWIGSAPRVHVLDHGSGMPLLLLHGGGGGGGNWYRLLEPLGRRARVVAPDLPGFGHSGAMPLELPLGRQAARLLVQLLDALEIPRANVLGTSFGGLAALRLAQHYPDRVQRLVLLDSAGLAAAAPALLWWATRPLVAELALRPSRAGTRQVLRRLLTSAPLPPEHEAALTDYLTASARAHGPSVPAALRAFLAGREQREWLDADELAAIGAPTLVLWGERDRFFPATQARAAARLLPRGHLRVIPGAGHSPNWERPEAVMRELQWFLFDEADGGDGEYAQEDAG